MHSSATLRHWAAYSFRAITRPTCGLAVRIWAMSTTMCQPFNLNLAVAPADCVIHNAEFAHWAGSEMGDQAAGAKALAMTAIDFFTDENLRAEVGAAFAATGD